MANPDIEKLIKLSELYGCSIDYIVGNDNKIDENRTNDELNKNIDEANNSENNNDNIDKRKKKINIIIGCLSEAPLTDLKQTTRRQKIPVQKPLYLISKFLQQS